MEQAIYKQDVSGQTYEVQKAFEEEKGIRRSIYEIYYYSTSDPEDVYRRGWVRNGTYTKTWKTLAGAIRYIKKRAMLFKDDKQ